MYNIFLYIYIYIYNGYIIIEAREREGNIKATCVNKSNGKCFGNEPQSLHSKGKPHSRE